MSKRALLSVEGQWSNKAKLAKQTEVSRPTLGFKCSLDGQSKSVAQWLFGVQQLVRARPTIAPLGTRRWDGFRKEGRITSVLTNARLMGWVYRSFHCRFYPGQYPAKHFSTSIIGTNPLVQQQLIPSRIDSELRRPVMFRGLQSIADRFLTLQFAVMQGWSDLQGELLQKFVLRVCHL